jgi:hypothetical protein
LFESVYSSNQIGQKSGDGCVAAFLLIKGINPFFILSEKDFQRKKRAHNIMQIPLERRTLRANVETTVSEFKRKMPDDKVKVRGRFKTTIFAIATGIGTNFGRIVRYLDDLVPGEIPFATAS